MSTNILVQIKQLKFKYQLKENTFHIHRAFKITFKFEYSELSVNYKRPNYEYKPSAHTMENKICLKGNLCATSETIKLCFHFRFISTWHILYINEYVLKMPFDSMIKINK